MFVISFLPCSLTRVAKEWLPKIFLFRSYLQGVVNVDSQGSVLHRSDLEYLSLRFLIDLSSIDLS